MNSESPLTFHRRRIETLSNTLGAWMVCGSASCRRKGRCRRGDDVLPACVLPVLREVNAGVRACLGALPKAALRAEAAEESGGTQLDRITRRLGNLVESQLDKMEWKWEGRAGR